MVVSVLMHWLISQSFFVVQIVQIQTWLARPDQNPNGDVADLTTTTAGFSPMAMFLTAFVVLAVFSTTVGLGRFKLEGGIPIAGSYSAAIAAACHAPEGTSNQRPVKWGVVVPAESAPGGGVGHCSFSNDPVQLPEPGGRYA
ncbi:unnamed protein product [Clonostachys byssicola]|uniref:Uncharacterized protein n=1 Tax=Clonostachys byssicola TaxID=160290 RepID=A0A9N9UNC7_9HYPO|nr:unnamed protein product [Clonostachys byssicola]